jgi:hypothetical protein
MAENQDVIYGSENGVLEEKDLREACDFWLRKENVDLASMTYLGGSN